MIYPIKWPDWYHQGSSWMINKPLVGLLMEPFCQSGLKTAKTSYFSNTIQLSLNRILSEIFQILGVNKQMFICCDPDEPYRSPKQAYFNHLIGIYFLSFFYEHPVVQYSILHIPHMQYSKLLNQAHSETSTSRTHKNNTICGEI